MFVCPIDLQYFAFICKIVFLQKKLSFRGRDKMNYKGVLLLSNEKQMSRGNPGKNKILKKRGKYNSLFGRGTFTGTKTNKNASPLLSIYIYCGKINCENLKPYKALSKTFPKLT